jgi:hypothetical protein
VFVDRRDEFARQRAIAGQEDARHAERGGPVMRWLRKTFDGS